MSSPWDRFFFTPQSTSPMTLVRIGWGALMALWAVSLLPDIDPFFTDGDLRYDRALPAGSWNLLDWLGWEHGALAACLLLLVTSVTTTVGFRTRLSAAVAVLCLIALQRANTTIFNSGDLVLRFVGISVALAPCGLLWSVDAALARRRGHLTGPAPWRAPWALRLLQLQVAVGYLLSAWAKLRGDMWHEGTALGMALRIEDLQRFAAPEWIFEQSVLLNALTWATLVFEACFLFLVWNRRLRPWVIGAGVLFHLGIDIVLDIGFFSAALWLSYAAFVFPSAADRIVGRHDPEGVGRGADAQRPPVEVGVAGGTATR